MQHKKDPDYDYTKQIVHIDSPLETKKSKRKKSQPPAENVSPSAASELQEESAPTATCPTASSSLGQAPMEVEQAVDEPIPMVEIPEQAEEEEIISKQTETAPSTSSSSLTTIPDFVSSTASMHDKSCEVETSKVLKTLENISHLLEKVEKNTSPKVIIEIFSIML